MCKKIQIGKYKKNCPKIQITDCYENLKSALINRLFRLIGRPLLHNLIDKQTKTKAKAFDSIRHEGLLFKSRESIGGGKPSNIIKLMYRYKCVCVVKIGKNISFHRAVGWDRDAAWALQHTVEVGSLHTLRLESIKLVFQPLYKFIVNKQ